MKRLSAFVIIGIFALSLSALFSGCSLRPDAAGPDLASPVLEPVPTAGTSNSAQVTFRISVPQGLAPNASVTPVILPLETATPSPTVKFMITTVNFGNSDSHSTTLQKTVEVVGGTATATFDSLPVTTVVGEVEIFNGKYLGFTKFRGARDLVNGLNELTVEPKESATLIDLVAATILRLVGDSGDFATLNASLSERLTNLFADVDLGATTRYDTAVSSYRDSATNTAKLGIVISPPGAGTVQVTPDATTTRVSKGTVLTLKLVPNAPYLLRGFKEASPTLKEGKDTYSYSLEQTATLTALFEEPAPDRQWEEKLNIGGVTHILFEGSSVVLAGGTNSNSAPSFPSQGSQDAFLGWLTAANGSFSSGIRLGKTLNDTFDSGVWVNGHYYGGYSYDTGTSHTQGYGAICRLDGGGVLSEIYQGGPDARIYIMISAGTNLYAALGNPGRLLKMDLNGTVAWSKERDTVSIRGLAVDSSGNLFAAEFPAGGPAALVKYSPGGVEMWRKTLADTAGEVYPLAIDSLGNVVVACRVQRPRPQWSDWYIQVAKYDTNGTQLWVENSAMCHGSDNTSEVKNLAIDSEGNIYAGGYGPFKMGVLPPFVSGINAIFVMKFNSDGRRLWTMDTLTEDYSKEYTGGFVTLDPSDNLYVGGDYRDSTNQSWTARAMRFNK